MKQNQIANSLSLRLIIAFFVLQWIFAFILLPILGYQTIFPFSTWNLFGAPPRIKSVPLIYIQQVNLQQYEPLVEGHKYFRPMESNRNYHQAHDIMSYETDRMHEQKDTIFSLAVAERVARIFWSAKDNIKFEIRMVRLNTVDFFIHESIIEYDILGTFHFRDNTLVPINAESSVNP